MNLLAVGNYTTYPPLGKRENFLKLDSLVASRNWQTLQVEFALRYDSFPYPIVAIACQASLFDVAS